MPELSQFEELSAKTPTKTPYAIVAGTVLLVFALWLINTIAPNEGVKDLKEKAAEKENAAQVGAVDDGDEL
jgi:hypothetical protein